MDKVTGFVTGVNGNLVSASFSGSVRKNEVGYVLVGDDDLRVRSPDKRRHSQHADL